MTIGELLVRLEADTKGFAGGMKSGIKGMEDFSGSVTKHAGIASKAFGALEAPVKGLGKVISGLGSVAAVGLGVLAAVAVENMISVGQKAMTLVTQEDAINAQTNAVLKSTKDASGETAAGIDAMALSLSQMSGTAKDTIVQGENLLLTFTNIKNSGANKVFDQATAAALNMSTALGTDLTTTSRQLGRALNDPAQGMAALTRVGVQFTAQEKEQIKTLEAHGHLVQAQELILSKLQTKFGGSAQAFGDSSAGAMAKIANSTQEAEKSLARLLLPALEDLLQMVPPMVDGVSNWVDANKVLLGQISTGLVKGVQALGQGLQWAAVNVLPKVVAGFQWLATNVWPKMVQGFQWATKNIIPALGQAFDWIAANVIPALGQALDWLTKNVVPAMGQAFAWIQKNVLPPLGAIAKWLANEVWPALSDAFNWTVTNVLPKLVSAFDWLQKNVLVPLGKGIDWITRNILPPLNDALDWLGKNVLPGVWTAMQTLGAIAQTIFLAMQTVVATVVQTIENLGAAIQNAGSILQNNPIAGLLGGGGDTLKNLSGLIPHFDQGGVVPGPVGAPLPILAHGGERVLTPAQQAAAGGGVHVTIGSITLTGIGSDVSPSAARSFAQQIIDGIAQGMQTQGSRMSEYQGSRP